MSDRKFEFKKNIFDSKSDLFLFSFIIAPIILFRKGSLDLSLVCILFPVCFLSACFSLTNIFKISILSNKTQLINIFGKTTLIPNNEIFFSEEYHIREKNNLSHDIQTLKLEIQIANRKLTIYKDEHQNYDKLIQYCKQNFQRQTKQTINYNFYIFPVWVICFSIYLFFFTRNCFEKKNEDNFKSIQQFGYVKLNGTFNDYNVAGKGSGIIINLKEYPEFSFSATDFVDNEALYYRKLSSHGNKITLYISPNEYAKKIKKSTSQKFYDKYFKYNEITMYKLE